MPIYYQNAQGYGFIIEKDDAYADDLHDTYFTAGDAGYNSEYAEGISDGQEGIE